MAIKIKKKTPLSVYSTPAARLAARVAMGGYGVSREPFWLLMGLLAAEPEGFGCEAEVDDDLLPDAMAGPVPGWAVDAFTHEGKLAISRFLLGASPTPGCCKAT